MSLSLHSERCLGKEFAAAGIGGIVCVSKSSLSRQPGVIGQSPPSVMLFLRVGYGNPPRCQPWRQKRIKERQ